MPPQEDRQPPIYTTTFVQMVAGAFLMIALLNSRRDLALLSILILAITGGARLWSRFSLRGVTVHSSVDRNKLFPDEWLQVNLRISNRKWLPVRLHLEMLIKDDLPLPREAPDHRQECGLLWYQQVDFQWRLKAWRRGVFQLGPAHIQTSDFLGFFKNAKNTEASPLEIIVYPRIVPLKPTAFPRTDFFGIPGAKSPVQDPIYILGTRDYQSGRPARHIHWKASARRNHLQEKVFEPSSQTKILFMVDVALFAEYQAEADFEHILELSASMMVHCEKSGYTPRFLTNGLLSGHASPRLLPSRGSQQLSAIMEILARLRMKANQPLSELLHQQGFMPWGLSAVCFSYQNTGDIAVVQSFFVYRRIPLVSIVSRGQAATSAVAGNGHGRVLAVQALTWPGVAAEAAVPGQPQS